MFYFEALRWGTKQLNHLVESPHAEAQKLLLAVLKITLLDFLNRGNNLSLNSFEWKNYQQMVKRRAKKEPLQYIIGQVEFYGLNFKINHHVLIPRPETEVMVDLIIKSLNPDEKIIAVDVGTGSGIIACTLAKHLPSLKIYAIDISSETLKVTQGNIKLLHLENQIIILKSDLLQNLPEKADLIIANLPYLNQEKISSLPLEILSEPIIALDGGGDGLLIIKKFLVQTPIFLKKGGQIYLEIDHGQGYKLKKLAKKIYPQATISINQDLQKLERVLIIRT